MLLLTARPMLADVSGAPDAEIDPETLLEEIRSAALVPDQALDAAGLLLNTGAATLELESGVLIPVRNGGSRAVEMVFVGRGRARLEPPDEVEAGQLELFTGSPRLDEVFIEAVFVVARDEAADALLDRPPVEAVDGEILRRAGERYAAWKDSPERQTLGVETGILLDALGDPVYEDYFAGWFMGAQLGPFLLQIDPAAEEQINLGQFVRFDVTPEERLSLSRFLHRQQQRGRLLGLEVKNLGRWDSWVKAAVRDAEGKPRPGSQGFEPQHYLIDVTVDPRDGHLVSHTRMKVRALSGVRRIVSLELHGELAVTRLALASPSEVSEGDRELFFWREGNRVQVLLPQVPRADAELELEIVCEGVFLESAGDRGWALRDALGWYPRFSANERATYDVTLRWPRRFELLASGQRVDGGNARGKRWERRRLEIPAFGFSFEIGRFKVRSMEVGDVRLRVAFDPATWSQTPERSVEELMLTIANALSYYQGIFGPYPLNELAVITVPRQYSQALLGMITLSSRVMADWGVSAPLLQVQDQRSVVAHEVAHQWWGHLVGWRSYRDQWISEAMANYAALLWARHRGLEPAVGPLTGWQQELTATVSDGRPLESVGPLVLGERLFSSRSQDAYHAIIYRKGALVLEMLARKFGEEAFRQSLKTLAASASGHVLSTRDFLSLLERITGSDLDAFARQFIFGTGLPEIDYDYAFEHRDNGHWQVRVSARQELPARIRYRVVALGDGRFDVARERVESPIDVAGSDLVVPLQILLANGSDPAGSKPSEEGLTRDFLIGQMLISGPETEFELEIDRRPEQLWLDRDREIFGLFVDRRQHPRRMLLKEASRLATAGQLPAAEDTLRRALVTPAVSGSADDLLAAHLHLRLAGVLLDRGQDPEAAQSLQRARDAFESTRATLPGPEARRFASAFEILEARIEVRRGDYPAAITRLRGDVLDPEDSTSTEGYLLLAIATKATGQIPELEEVLEIARRRGADVSLLRATSAEVP